MVKQMNCDILAQARNFRLADVPDVQGLQWPQEKKHFRRSFHFSLHSLAYPFRTDLWSGQVLVIQCHRSLLSAPTIFCPRWALNAAALRRSPILPMRFWIRRPKLQSLKRFCMSGWLWCFPLCPRSQTPRGHHEVSLADQGGSFWHLERKVEIKCAQD